MRIRIALGAATALASLVAVASPASALSMKECSAKYQAAKQAGGTAKWQDFRKTECGGDSTSGEAATPTVPAAPAATKPSATRAAPTSANAGPGAGSVEYPSAIDPKYANEKPGKARLHTCRDSYETAKAAGTLGGTKWSTKGGGYYSGCNAHLKG